MNTFLKNTVKNFLTSRGYEIRNINNSFANRTTRSHFLRFVANLGFKPNTVIDVGVADGTNDLYEAFPAAKIILVEPLREWEPKLKEIAKSYNAQYILAAAGKKTEEISINVHANLSSSSTLNESDGKVIDGISRKIPQITIDEICKEKGLSGSFVLKIDVQGAEINVLEGSQNMLPETELVLLEVQLFQFFKQGPQFFDVISYMKSKGFVLYDIYDLIYRPFDGALAAVDAAFVKENGYFRKQHHFRKIV